MSNSLLAKATQALKAKMEAGKRLRQQHKQDEEVLFTGVATLGGGVAAALVDTKISKNGQPHKLFAKADGTGGLPTNIAAGAVIAAGGMLGLKASSSLKAPVVAGGLSLASAGLYRYIVDHAAQNPS